MMIRGGGNPHPAMAAMPLREWARRLGALPAEAYHCFMVRTQGSTEYKRGSRLIRGPMAGSPRILARPTTRSPQPAAVLASVKDEPSAALKKRRPCPPLRATAMEICGRGGRMLGGAGRTKEWNDKGRQKWRDTLDKESPIQAGCGKSACPVVCPVKAGMFSRRQTCRGRSQSPVVWIAE